MYAPSKSGQPAGDTSLATNVFTDKDVTYSSESRDPVRKRLRLIRINQMAAERDDVISFMRTLICSGRVEIVANQWPFDGSLFAGNVPFRSSNCDR